MAGQHGGWLGATLDKQAHQQRGEGRSRLRKQKKSGKTGEVKKVQWPTSAPSGTLREHVKEEGGNFAQRHGGQERCNGGTKMFFGPAAMKHQKQGTPRTDSLALNHFQHMRDFVKVEEAQV